MSVQKNFGQTKFTQKKIWFKKFYCPNRYDMGPKKI